MCRLFGFRSIVQLPVHHSLREAENALAKQSRQHPDGWGIGYYLDNDPYLQKGSGSAFRDYDYARISEMLASETVVAHIRRATVGRTSEANSHPFVFRQWMFAHNGEVEHYDRVRAHLRGQIPVDLRKCIQGDTDSENIFHLFLGYLREHSARWGEAEVDPASVRRALLDTIDTVDEHVREVDSEVISPLNMVVTNGRIFIAVKRGKELFYSTQKKLCSDFTTCPRATKECLAPLGPMGSINHLIVSSERISEEDVWEEMPDGSILTVDEDLSWRMDRIASTPQVPPGMVPGRGRFVDRVVVVTAVTTELGRWTAYSLASEGAVVALVGTEGQALAEIERDIRMAGGKAFAVVGDPEDESSAADLADRVASSCGAVDTLVLLEGVKGEALLEALRPAPGSHLVVAGPAPDLGTPRRGSWSRVNGVVTDGNDPSRVTPVILFLASSDSTLLNGAMLRCSDLG